MNEIIKSLELYLSEVLDVQAKACPWKDKDQFPHFLISSYEFYEIALLNHPCLLMVAKKGISIPPASIRKHRDQVLVKWDGCCIYVQEAISSYNRQRLIQHHIPFIAPGNQMYLPDLGIDLREYFRQPKPNKEFLSPATQAVVVYALCNDPSEGYAASELIKALAYSRMTLIRAFDELKATNIGIIDRKGRERRWSFKGSKRELWEQANPLLSTPVKRRIWIKGKGVQIKAGLSALAEYSMLNPPTIPTYAINADDWKNCQKSGIEVLPISEGATAELEIWQYDTRSFSENDLVDPFSLYLSLRDTEDERIEAALEEMMEKIEW